ncbi:MAG: SpoIID/LytB domain-containing protein [Actinomycetota bacterium]
MAADAEDALRTCINLAAAISVGVATMMAPGTLASAEPAAPAVAASSGDLVVAGHGWGHRRGLGQYGSLGYAIDHGWSTGQILDHFYGGTTAGTVDANQEMTVRIMSHDLKPLAVQVDSGRIATFTPGGAPASASGRAVKIEAAPGGFRVSDADTCAGPWTARSGTVSGTELRARAADITTFNFSYGAAGDVPITGDWNGDGVDSPGVWRAGRFLLRNSVSGGSADLSFSYGRTTDVPIVGDWNGDGIDTVGVRRGNILYLRNSNSGGAADISFSYGTTADLILVGDWNGDRVDTVGIRRGTTWMLRNSNTSGGADLTFTYGLSTDAPVIGNWDGQAGDGVGVRRNTTWYLRDSLSSGSATRTFSALQPGPPVAGHWTGDAADFVGRVSGTAWELGRSPQGGGVVLLDGNDQPLDRTLQLCHATSTGAWTATATSSRFYRGELRAIATGSGGADLRVVNALGLDWYVRGVVPRESPASWGNVDCVGGTPDCGQRALEAQAVAARSYSLGENRYPYAKTCDTISCQVYGGRAYRVGGTSTITISEATNTNNAVAATSGAVRLTGTGSVARTEFSSSTGGWTAGGVFPSVVDDGDDTPTNPNHSWTTTITASQLNERYGLGTLQAATVTSRSAVDGRAVTGMRLDFSLGSVTRSGDGFRQEWGLKSAWFDLTAVGVNPAHPARVGVRRGNVWYLRHALAGGGADVTFSYGTSSDVPVVGDWNADGIDTPGVKRGSTWLLRNSSSSGAADITFTFGQAADAPLAGDWDGDGTMTVGLRRGTWWYLRNSNSSGEAQVSPFSYGLATDVPVVGDWDGDGIWTPGIYRNGTFHLRNSLSGGNADLTVATGFLGSPIAGDWDADGVTDLGVHSGNTFRLLRTPNGSAMGTFSFGAADDVALAGRWV